MALGNTNIYLRGDGTNNGLYKEMGKGITANNISLGQSKYGQNDYNISQYASANPSEVRMSYWQLYTHDNMTFRFNPAQTGDYDTYEDTDANYFGTNGQGIPYTNNGGNPGAITNTWDYPGMSAPGAYGEFNAVNSGVAYKQGVGGITVICGWFFPRDNSSGQTDIFGNDIQLGAVTTYRGYRFAIATSFRVRVVRGDGGGTSSTNRRTFESNFTVAQNEWNFFVWQGEYNSITIGTANNYMYGWNQLTGWQGGTTFLSGAGGNLSYTNTQKWIFSPAANGGRYFDGDIGGWYVFDKTISASNLQRLRDYTKPYYGL